MSLVLGGAPEVAEPDLTPCLVRACRGAECCPRAVVDVAAAAAALTPAANGWRMLVGGRLGRHPRLGAEVSACADLDGALTVATKVVELWEHEGRPDERVGALLERLADQEDLKDGEEARNAALTRLLLAGEVEES